MKNKLIIAVCLLTLFSCTKKKTTVPAGTTTSDTTFNGSYLDVSYNSKSFNCKDAVVGSVHYNMLMFTSTTLTASPNGTVIGLFLTTGISGISQTTIYFAGSGSTGTYTQSNFPAAGYTSSLLQTNPSVLYNDTVGTANITYNGSDYVQGSFNVTLYANGSSYPATGNFKIYH